MKPLLLKFPVQGSLPPGVLDVSAPAAANRAAPSPIDANRPASLSKTTAPPVVCLHGTVASGGNWGHLATLLLEGGRIVAAPTYGERGTAPLLGNYAEVTGVVRRVLEETGAPRVDVVGHSQGGLLAGMMVAAMLRGDGNVPFAEFLDQPKSPRRHPDPPGRGHAPSTIAPAPLPPGSIRRVVCISGNHRGSPAPRWAPGAWPRALFGQALADQITLRKHGVAPAIAGLAPGPDWIDLVTDADRIVPPSSAVTRGEYAAARTIRLEDALGRGVAHQRQPHDHGVGKLIADLLADD